MRTIADVIYANHAGTSWPKPPGVLAAVTAALTADPGENAAIYRDAHAAIAASMGVADRSRLMLTGSATAALGIVLGDLPWQAGDVVITSRLEHHALARPVQKLVWERGVEHVMAPYRPGAPIDLDFVAARLRQGSVRLVAVTGASNVTGERLPIAELAALAHEHGALLLLDAAQTAGVTPLSVEQLGVDLLVVAGHKAMLGPLGIGGFWAGPQVAFTCPSAACEVGAGGEGGGRRSGPFPGFCDVGSVNLPAAAGLAAAVRWLDACPDVDRERPLRLARRLLEECRARPHCHVLGGDGPRTAAVSLTIDGLPLTEAQQHFRQRGIIVRAGQHCAPLALEVLDRRDGCLRISFGVSNADEDLPVVLDAIDDVR